ncbi:hypothetical protein GOP47_0000604 [Adiantum capillus-veneris]|uniref:Sulfite exporter TauE/SafE family protein n=1 Tax=Adiantum capillus-veneris TaxID=13818 RepID=A0A9D4VDB0_ADICA|nr:hypothetical protein GOP47_0000604 [Adiantum capillus-veneris]
MNMPPHDAFFLIAALLLVVIGSFIRPAASHPFTNFTHLDTSSTPLWEKESFFSPHQWQSSSTIELPALWRTITALICDAAAAAISSAGGIGGGGLYVPIFNLLLGVSSKTSAALSSCMIVGGTFVTLVLYSHQRKADGAGPLIDYQVSLLLPSQCASWHLRRCRNAFKRWKMETSALQAATISSSISRKDGTSNKDDAEKKDLEKPLLDVEPKKLVPQYPMEKIAILCIIWVAFLAVQIVRGSSNGQNFFNIQSCGVLFWVVTAAQVPFAFIATACIMFHLRRTNVDADVVSATGSSSLLEDPFFQGVGPMSWLSALAFVTGFFGGMLGLGGGMIINPFLLELGMHPQATAATCSFMVFFASSLSAIQFWLLGRIPKEITLVSAALALVCSVVGVQGIQTIIKKYRRVSLIVFAVSIVMGLSAALMAIFGSWDVVIQIEQGEYMGFRSPC